MALYSIKQETLTDIGDALRRKWGETHEELKYENYAVCKTDGSTGFDNLNTISITAGSGYEIRETYTFKGVAYIVVKMSYYYESGMWFSINGEEILANTDITNIFEKRFDNNEVSFVIYRSNGDSSKLIDYGLYAEIRGYDVDGNLIPYSVTTVQVPNTYKSSEMAQAIDDILPSPPEEAFVISGNCNYRFANNGWNWFIEKYENKITTNNISDASNMFNSSNKITEIPFDLNFSSSASYHDLTNIFSYCNSLTQSPKLNNVKVYNTYYMFSYCYNLRTIPEDIADTWDWSYVEGLTSPYSGGRQSHMFDSCYSLRSVPLNLIKSGNPYMSYIYSYYNYGFYGCYALDELINLPIPYTKATWTSNTFSETFYYCSRLKNATFALNNGVPYTVTWKSQVIDLSSYVGYAGSNVYTQYNSGITADKEVKDDASYQLLKNDPDWFTCNVNYSRYNHDSAVATINSLPDTSAYLASAGGTNTIKFNGQAGASTDGGAINTLTEEEIAVAAAKGWTCSFV